MKKIEMNKTYIKNDDGEMILNKLKVEKTKEGKQGELVTVFHYLAPKETGISDGDTLITVSLTHEFPFTSSYEKMHESKAPLCFQNKEFWTKEMLQHARPISEEEFLNR